jgi:NitT/TauT family transport system substrate-binding protein
MYPRIKNLLTKTLIPVLVSLVSSSVLFLTGCTQSENKELKVGTNIWIGYEPGYIAELEGLYQSTPVNMRQFTSATEVMRAFRNRLIDVAALTLDEALQLAQHDDDVAVILVADISDGADVIMARPEIKTVSGLAGKRVAAEGSAVGAFIIARAFEQHQVDPKSVDVVSVTVDEAVAAYDNNQIDAVVTFEPFRTKLLNAGAVEIFSSKQIPNEIVDVLVARKSAIEEDAASLRDFVAGWIAAVELIKTSPEKVNPIIARRLEITIEEAELAYDSLKLPDLATNQSLLTGQDPTLTLVAGTLNRLLLEQGLIEKSVSVDDLFSGVLVKGL